MISAHLARLGPADLAALDRLLTSDSVTTVYLRSELRINAGAAPWWGVSSGTELRAAVLAGPLAVPWIPDAHDAPLIADALGHAGLPRMMVGHRESILALHAALQPMRRPRQFRDPQRVMVIDHATAGRLTIDGTPPVRRATRADLEPLILAAAAMHREEMGVDPLAVDAPAWRARMTTLVDRGWSWIWVERGEIVFKTELSAWTPDCVQLQGVYVAPHLRRRGVGAAGLSEVVRRLLAEGAACSLYVNHYNDAALRLYARLGFRHQGDFATVIY